jgi:IclR family transcriptional regulator, acetate operon repressor
MLMPKRTSGEIAGSAEPERNPTGLLERTLGVLELLAANAHGLLLTEIAERLGMPQSATHRVLASLVERGYVRQPRGHGPYLLTAKIASLAFTYLAGSGVTNLAQPILDRIAREAGELVRLALVDGRQLIWVAKAQGAAHGLRYDPDMGQIGQLSCSASGHAWLACLPDDEAVTLVERQGYGSRDDYGPKAPQTRAALLRYLRQARSRGFAVVVQTYSSWMNAVAAPIRAPSPDADVLGAVVMAGPDVRLTEERMLRLAPLLVGAADELALAMVADPSIRAVGRGSATSFFSTNGA